MRNLDCRVQLLLDEPRYRKLTGEARRRRVSVAAVIREAIDQLPAVADQRRAAIAEVLDAEPMSVPSDPTELRREVDSAHDRAGRSSSTRRSSPTPSAPTQPRWRATT